MPPSLISALGNLPADIQRKSVRSAKHSDAVEADVYAIGSEFVRKLAEHLSQATAATIAKWFPQSRNHRLWGDVDQFHTIICKGCWPLSPYATWCMFYLAAAGKHLQERSALALLGDMFGRFAGAEVVQGRTWRLWAVDLWSDSLQQELISSEETGQQGATTHAYASVISRHGSALTGELQRILCAVVLASQLGLQVDDRNEAILALGDLAGVPEETAQDAVGRLQDEYNVLDWDQAFRAFDILGDAVPRNQFLAFVRQRVASAYDETGKAQLFVSKAASWCELLVDLDCDFAEENSITTREWRYQAVTSNLNFLRQQIAIASDRWTAAVGVDEPRGTVSYTYVEPSRVPVDVLSEASRLLKSAARDVGASALPILVVLLCDEDAISQGVQNGMFRGKFMDLTAPHRTDLIPVGEGSAEWETLLDDWEQCESHLARKSCLTRSVELKTRVPVPPAIAYREARLREQAVASLEALTSMEEKQNDAAAKIEQGRERCDVGLLTWGAAALKATCDQMAAEKPAWTDAQIAEVQPLCEKARQAVVLLFPDWITRQCPRSDSPDAVGEFKHKMLHLVGGNLKRLGLEELFRQTEVCTLQIIRKAETVVEARQLVRDVQSWLTARKDATRVVRIAELKGFREVGTEYTRKLQGMWERIQTPDIAVARPQLSAFLSELKEAETTIADRASALWDAKIRTEDDLTRILTEVDALTVAYDSMPADLEDLQLMRRALKLHQRAYQRLSDEKLTDAELEGVAAEIRSEIDAVIGEDELPWPPDETIDEFLGAIRKHRKELSTRWIDSLEKDADGIQAMSAGEANRLHARLNAPPAVLTEPHAKRLQLIAKKVDARLDALSVEWLIEKFRELPAKSRREFLSRARQIIDERQA
ncbi:MAG: hypothetical protein ACM359_01505 [Bacillota bacterium]